MLCLLLLTTNPKAKPNAHRFLQFVSCGAQTGSGLHVGLKQCMRRQVRELKPHEVRRVLDLGAQNNNPEINPYFSALPPGPEYRMRVPA